MSKKLTIFFVLHFFIVITLAAYMEIKDTIFHFYDKRVSIPVLGDLKNKVYDNKYFTNYLILSGINTGYGFFGLGVSTDKYLTVTLYDSSKNMIDSTDYFNFRTQTAYNRFKGYASFLANYIQETEEIALKDKSIKGIEICKTRNLYINKTFKWLGKNYSALKNVNSRSYKVKLSTIVSNNIWEENDNKNLQIYDIKEIEFAVK